MNRNNQELITKKDYEILGIKENATPKEIGVAYEKLLQEYHPEKIKLKKLREPDEVELKKYQEIEKVYKKFDFEPPKYILENGSRKLFCSQECYNNNESPLANIENSLKYAKLSKEDLEPENRNYEQEFNRITIKNEADKE
ncbi:18363_t:CDS:2 [Funneliformis geosporum]|nr:18363_t:CDS:2 [Funneliformis geosporum]